MTLNESKERGAACFKDNKPRVPMFDEAFMKQINTSNMTTKHLLAWIKGWDEANMHCTEN